jgi:hypothetical protein
MLELACTTELGRAVFLLKGGMPMQFSLQEVITLGMLILAILTYLKRK